MSNSPVQTSWVDIPGDAGPFGGYLALPPGGRGPGLMLLQEIFGVNPHIRAVAEQYALAGFVVLAPDLFWRDATRVELGYVGADHERAYALMRNIQADTVLADLQATLAALRARPEFNGKVGALGYCMGGRLAYTAAAKLQAICTGRHTDSAKRAALEDLKVLDTSAAHTALETLTESKDQQVAVLATLTIGRAGYDGADEKLQSIYEDEKAAEAVRASALQAYARLAKAQGTSWESIESYGKKHCGRKSRLEAVLMSTKNVVAKAE